MLVCISVYAAFLLDDKAEGLTPLGLGYHLRAINQLFRGGM